MIGLLYFCLFMAIVLPIVCAVILALDALDARRFHKEMESVLPAIMKDVAKMEDTLRKVQQKQNRDELYNKVYRR